MVKKLCGYLLSDETRNALDALSHLMKISKSRIVEIGIAFVSRDFLIRVKKEAKK